MGCGKSSVGRRLSELLACPFMDLDAVIEKAEGHTIPEIFANEGEAAFRRMEASTLHDIVVPSAGSVGPLPASWALSHGRGWQNAKSIHQADTPQNIQSVQCVLALGGGTVMTPECAEMVHENTLCIYLRATTDTLLEHLTDEADDRPMLHGCTPGQASVTGKGRDKDPEALRERITDLMTRRSAIYEKTAHVIIDTDGRSIEAVAQEVTAAVRQVLPCL